MTDRVCGGGMGRRARCASAALAIAGALVGGCWGTAGGPASVRGEVSSATLAPMAMSPAPVDSLNGEVVPAPSASVVSSVSPFATIWPLPYASFYAHLPPAGSRGGPTKPCAPRVDWGEAMPLPPGSGRQAGLGCSDYQAVRYPVCTEEQVARAWRIDALMAARKAGGGSVDEAQSVRGYLRREWLYPSGQLWDLRLEARFGEAPCAAIVVGDWPAGSSGAALPGAKGVHGWICRGDPSMACCLSELVGSGEEIVYETGASPGQACVIRPGAPQGRVTATPRSAEQPGRRSLSFLPRYP